MEGERRDAGGVRVSVAGVTDVSLLKLDRVGLRGRGKEGKSEWIRTISKTKLTGTGVARGWSVAGNTDITSVAAAVWEN